MKIKRGENGADLTIKVKFFKLADPEEGEDQQYRIKFTKKRGNIMDWYELQKDLHEQALEGAVIEQACNTEIPAAE